jgi:4-diphosphocytidyl-2-C-methyl-D-erythritol kinase
VLLVPRFSVATSDAYRWYDDDRRASRPDRAPEIPPPTAGTASSSGRLVVGEVWNDLEPHVSDRHPEIGEMRRALDAEGARLHAMSGSGSTVFGLFDSPRNAARAARRLGRLPRTVIVARTLGSTDYRLRTALRPVRRLPPLLRIS